MVCPPPKTYTDLNLILIEAENVNMTETMREGLKKKVYGLLQDFALGKLMRVMNLIQEEGRNFNWFNGDSVVSLPWHEWHWSYRIVTDTDSSVSVSNGENLYLWIDDYQCKNLPKNYAGSLSLYAEKSLGTNLYVQNADLTNSQHINETFNCDTALFDLMADSQLDDSERRDAESILNINLTFSKSCICQAQCHEQCMTSKQDPLFSKDLANIYYKRKRNHLFFYPYVLCLDTCISQVSTDDDRFLAN